MKNSYAKEIVENTYTGGYPMTVFINDGEIYEASKVTEGGKAATSIDFNRIRFENLVIPLGIDSHVNTRPFVSESYHDKEIKTIDAPLFDKLFEKIAVIYKNNNSKNKTKKILKHV